MEYQREDNDYELLYMYRQQEDIVLRILIDKYKPQIRSIIQRQVSMMLPSAYKEDLYQIAIIKLPSAIDTFRFDHHTSFGTYYRRIVKNTVQDTIIKQIRYEQHLDGVTQRIGFEVCEDGGNYVLLQKRLISSEYTDRHVKLIAWLEDCKSKLGGYEYQVLCLRIHGYTYQEIADRLFISSDKVDYLLRKLRSLKDRIDYPDTL